MVVKPGIFTLLWDCRQPILRAYDGLQEYVVKLGNELKVDDSK